MNTERELYWQFNNRCYRESHVGFLRRIEDTLCIFSRSLMTLYCNYQLVRADHSRLQALPRALHDTFNNIAECAIKPTEFYIAPAEAICDNRDRLLLFYRCKKTGRLRAMDFKKSVETLKAQKFLPVIIDDYTPIKYGRAPIFPLYTLDLDQLTELSAFDRQQLGKTIQAKLAV